MAVLPSGQIVSNSYDGVTKIWDPNDGKCIEIIEKVDVDVSQMNLSNAILPKDLAKLLWQNGAEVPKPVLCEQT